MPLLLNWGSVSESCCFLLIIIFCVQMGSWIKTMSTCHPFVAFRHVLDIADAGSDVFMSVPFLGDLVALDQLCHSATPEYGGGLESTLV